MGGLLKAFGQASDGLGSISAVEEVDAEAGVPDTVLEHVMDGWLQAAAREHRHAGHPFLSDKIVISIGLRWCRGALGRSECYVRLFAMQDNPAFITTVRGCAWKAQLRLTKRFSRLSSRGVQQSMACVAVALELAGSVWAIARGASPTLN